MVVEEKANAAVVSKITTAIFLEQIFKNWMAHLLKFSSFQYFASLFTKTSQNYQTNSFLDSRWCYEKPAILLGKSLNFYKWLKFKMLLLELLLPADDQRFK